MEQAGAGQENQGDLQKTPELGTDALPEPPRGGRTPQKTTELSTEASAEPPRSRGDPQNAWELSDPASDAEHPGKGSEIARTSTPHSEPPVDMSDKTTSDPHEPTPEKEDSVTTVPNCSSIVSGITSEGGGRESEGVVGEESEAPLSPGGHLERMDSAIAWLQEALQSITEFTEVTASTPKTGTVKARNQ